MLRAPVCVIGAARSGTTVLSHLLAEHPDVAYWTEPKYLWRYRKPTVRHDVRTAEEATPLVRRYIRRRLERYVEENGASRLVEKTPSNCFRVPFVHAVLPDVRVIHIVRDGRDVAFSARKQWTSINDAGRDGDVQTEEKSTSGKLYRMMEAAWKRVRFDEVPVSDLPHYALRFARMFVRNLGAGESTVNVWGPKFPGIQEAAQTHDLLETCAIQWRESVQAARDGLQAVPNAQQLEIRFERFVENPADTVRAVLDFAELRRDAAVLRRAEEKIRPASKHRWKGRDRAAVERVMDVVGPFVRELETIE